MKKAVSIFVLLVSFYSIKAQQLTQNSYAELEKMANDFFYQQKYNDAIPVVQAIIEKAKNEKKDSIYFAWTSNLAQLYSGLGNYNEALILSTEATTELAKILGKENANYADALNNLGLLHSKLGDEKTALKTLTESKNIREKLFGREHPAFAAALNNLAEVYEKIGQYDLASSLYIQAKEIAEKKLGKEHPDLSIFINNVAYIYWKMGSYDLALPLFIQSKNIREKALGKEHPEYAMALQNVSMTYQQMGNYTEALPISIEAKNLREKAFGKTHPSIAESLSNLSLLYSNLDSFEIALSLALEEYDIYKKIFKKEHPKLAANLYSIATLYQKLKKYDMAFIYYQQAKDIYEKTLGPEHPDYINLLEHQALLYYENNNLEMSWNQIIETINALSNLKISSTISKPWADSLLKADYASNLHLKQMLNALKLVYLLVEKKETTSKIIIADLATGLLQRLRHQFSGDNDKLRTLSQSYDWLQRSFKVFDKTEHIEKAFELAEQNKAVLLLESHKAEQAYRLGNLPDSIYSLDKKNVAKRDLIQAKLYEKRPQYEKDSLRNALNIVNQDIEKFREMIKKKYPEYAKLKQEQINIKITDIQKILDPQTAFLEYLVLDSAVHVFYISHKKSHWVENLISIKELTQKIEDFHKNLSGYKFLEQNNKNAYENYTYHAFWFYKNLLQPSLNEAEGINNLIIVPDGELAHLPFEAFLVKNAPQKQTDYKDLHFLIQDYSISYNYSATLWKDNMAAPKPQNNKELLAMAANYEIKGDSTVFNSRLVNDITLRKNLIKLPAARKEVEILKEQFHGFFAFDKDASEKTIKEKAENYAVIHLAMHGLLNDKRPILSSLAFTEDSDSLENNFLQAYEISKMKLNADLVVLSACETGYGKFEKGNGIASLARAFFYAGASSLVVSLWQVSDYATSEIMKNFYQNLADGMKKDEALRQAKIKYLKEAKGILAHPAFWSPFILMGNTDAIALKQKGNSLFWIIGGIVLVLGIGAFVVQKRKTTYES